MPGSNNDINVLHQSHLFYELAQGRAPPTNFVVNGHQYSMEYYFADGIYSQWATLVQTISNPQGGKKEVICRTLRSISKGCRRGIWGTSITFCNHTEPSKVLVYGRFKLCNEDMCYFTQYDN